MIAIRKSARWIISRKQIAVLAERKLSVPSRQTAKTVDHVGETVSKMLNDIRRTEERSAISLRYLDQVVSDLESRIVRAQECVEDCRFPECNSDQKEELQCAHDALASAKTVLVDLIETMNGTTLDLADTEEYFQIRQRNAEEIKRLKETLAVLSDKQQERETS